MEQGSELAIQRLHSEFAIRFASASAALLGEA
jgi:hypothetical protein